MSDARCTICGELMPDGEEMFKFHGYSGPCPKPPLQRQKSTSLKISVLLTPERVREIASTAYDADPTLWSYGAYQAGALAVAPELARAALEWAALKLQGDFGYEGAFYSEELRKMAKKIEP